MDKIKNFLKKVVVTGQKLPEHHVAAYASQSAYFFILSLIPIILLLLTMVQFTPVTKADVMTAVIRVFPTSIDTMLTSIVNQVYNQSMGIIPVTVVVALWSAGKGVLALATGLNTIYGCPETRNYIYVRLRSTVYTVLFIMMLIVVLVLAVFGNTIHDFILENVPLLSQIAGKLLWMSNFIMPAALTVLFAFIYKYLPNSDELQLRAQIPGAILAAAGWILCSRVFSVYLDIFEGFSSMYGSLTTIVLIMLWMYFTMYCILLGGELNVMLGERDQED